MFTFRSFRHPSLRLDGDGRSLQDRLVERFQSEEVVVIFLHSGLPREVHVRDLARNDRQFTLEFRVQEVRQHSALRNRVYLHRQTCVTTTGAIGQQSAY